MKHTIFTLLFTLLFSIMNAQVVITDADLGSETYNWTSDNEYILDGYVFLEAGGVLNIEEGTVIKAKGNPSNGESTSALIIARGAQIYAKGSASKPIIFTAEFDDVNDNADLTKSDKGLWGGLLILGNGIVGVDGGEKNIEGIPSTETRGLYGGTDNEESSGELRYVSIRHAGDKLGADDEINGLTLGAVGSGTIIDYIEIYANLDDGIEWFGGAVNVKHAVVSFCGDDSFDYDQSWDGKGQFWFTIQDELSNRAGEWDGSEKADLTPKASPTISNATFIGAGVESTNDDGNDALRLRDDGAVKMYNTIITDFANQAIIIDNDADGGDLISDSYDRYLAGEIAFANLLFFNFGAGSESIASMVNTDGGDDASFADDLIANGSKYADPFLAGISRNSDNGLDPRLNAGSPGLTGAKILSDPFFDAVPYIGAFGNADNWANGWTALSSNAYFGDLVIKRSEEEIIINDSSINAGETLTLTSNNTYFLDGYVFVEEEATLIIEAGTVIKGLGSPSSGESTSALIIARGGKIIAQGRPDAPIIFTAEFDDVNSTDDLTDADKGLWGGILILGNGIVGVDGGEKNIEGIPSTETRAIYGGSDNTESSGLLKYVSIRHGGDKLGADDEINGLTLGAVGSGTTIDYIEVYANLDDGIEWFGGAVNVNHAVVSFCGDDSYDFDQSWGGKGQFWFSLQDELSNRGGEWDGSERADLGPKTSPILSNLTFIGAGTSSTNDDGNDALRIRDDGAAKVYNSIFTDFANGGIIIDNDADGNDLISDSYNRFLEGEITFTSSVFFGFGNGDDLVSIVDTDGGDNGLLVEKLTEGGSVYADPGIAGISRTNDGGLDPRINGNGAAFGIATPVPDDDYFETVGFAGAFGGNNWASAWTALSYNGYFGNQLSSTNDHIGLSDLSTAKLYPNPSSNGIIHIEFDLEESRDVNLHISDMNGRLVKTLSEEQNFVNGSYRITANVDDLANGYYIVSIITDQEIFSNKLIINK